MRIIYFFSFIILLTSCNQDPEVRVLNYVEENGPIIYDNEEQVCDLIDREIVSKYLGYDVEYDAEPQNMQAMSLYGASCQLNWTPPSNIAIERKKVEDYLHVGFNGRIKLSVLSNFKPETNQSWGANLLNNGLNKKIDDPDITNQFNYSKVENLEFEAIWNSPISSIKWHIANQVYLILKVEYPLPSEERKELAIELAREVNQNLVSAID